MVGKKSELWLLMMDFFFFFRMYIHHSPMTQYLLPLILQVS